MRGFFLILCCGLLCGGCVTHYRAPSNAKLEASTKRLSNAVIKATNTAERARARVEAAQKAADREAAASASVITQVTELERLVPAELRGKVTALRNAIDEQQAATGDIVTNVNGAQGEHVQLTKDLAEAKAARLQVDVDKQEYYDKADKLAQDATKESTNLAWYRRHWWGSWIVLGLGIVACAVVAFLKFTGRLAIGTLKL